MRTGAMMTLLPLFIACGSADDGAPRVVVEGAAGSGAVAGKTGAGIGGGSGAAGASAHGGASGGNAGSGGSSGVGGVSGSVGSSGAAGSGAAGSGAMGGAAGSGGSAGSASGASGSVGTGGASGSGSGGACSGVDLPSTLTFQLASAAFPSPDHPSVAVHVPPGFRPCDHPGALVFFHGFDNCVENVIGSTDTPCEAGGPARSALHLSEQLDAVHVNAMLVAVELSFDKATGDPGALAEPGALRALLHELLVDHLDGMLGAALDVEDLERVVLASHSGGYWATAVVLDGGAVPQITEVDLFDSLYGYESTFEGWMKGNLQSFDPSAARPFRFVDVYTTGGDTLANSQSMASSVTSDLDAASLGGSLLDDSTTATLVDGDYAHPVLFKHSALAHDDVPRYYLQRVLPHAGFTPL